jgi:hypothetical protein
MVARDFGAGGHQSRSCVQPKPTALSTSTAIIQATRVEWGAVTIVDQMTQRKKNAVVHFETFVEA